MEMESLFLEIGLSEAKAKETTKNAKVAKQLVGVIEEAKKVMSKGGSLAGPVGVLLYHIATKLKPQSFCHAPLLVKYVVQGQIDSELRLNAAMDYLLKHNPESTVKDVKALEAACGVGVVVTPEQIEQVVEDTLKVVKDELLAKRYRYPAGLLMTKVRQALPWADGKAVKAEIDMQMLDLLGPKTEADLAPAPKAPKDKKNKGSAKKEETKKAAAVTANGDVNADEDDDGAASIAELMKTKMHLHQPGKNYTMDGYVRTPKTTALLDEHLKRTGGGVRTRFPPEPNGLLHIGHAKAININFGYAAAHDGVCFLRYDDTNPEKEEQKFFDGIKDVVEWLGYKPFEITHSSDYFQQLYEWAKVLISKDLAYVCHQKTEDIRGFNPPPSPYRERPTSESMELFEAMKNGLFDEGEATLRLKVTLEEGKQDPVAYRIKYTAHHRSGDEWCVYPTYDYTHCLCDSIEDITHSLCTKEFANRRSSYYWLCNALDIYCPVQWEYGRLNISYTVVSKRKIGKLITSGICKDWDDPRLFTLTALRRRGFPPEAVNNFVARMGVTGAIMVVDPPMLESFVRSHLNLHAPRTMVVLEPLKVNILNLVKDVGYDLDVPDFPDQPEKGSHPVGFASVIYIEHSDFKETPEKGYRRLAPGQSVGLRYANYTISVVRVHKDKQGHVTSVDAECTPVDQVKEKPKAFIHWVTAQDPLEIEVRLYDRLFHHRNPEDATEVPGGFLSDVNTDSLKVLKSVADKSLAKAKVFDKFQFERTGFFSVDPDSKEGQLVFNRTVSLKEDNKKN